MLTTRSSWMTWWQKVITRKEDTRTPGKTFVNRPNLANQIVGMLTRFWQNSIAFMKDIEAMYYQVMVPEHRKTFIKLLWWIDHNIDKDSIFFAMCVHVFGGASLVSWLCKLCLKKNICWQCRGVWKRSSWYNAKQLPCRWSIKVS